MAHDGGPTSTADTSPDPGQLLRLRQRLMSRIGRKYHVATAEIELDGLRFSFTRIANPDIVLDQVADEESRRMRRGLPQLPDDQLHLPYWAELWDSALGIGRFLVGPAGRPLIFSDVGTVGRGASVLDLGCGMGMAGTMAAALGAFVLFADLESPALLFAALNSLPWRSRVRTRRLNWQRDVLGERFDLIIGADVIYEKAQWAHLEPFWRKHLGEGGAVLLGEPGRQSGEAFLEWIDRKSWSVELHEQPVPTRQTPIRIIVLRQR